MMRSLFSGVSGLKAHQTRMDVIGNNIANVNTTGFKSSRTTFADTLSQTQSGASSATDVRGGVNPKQIGLGVGVSSIDLIFTDASPNTTGKNTDLALTGNGLFVVGEGSNTYYTRNGAFEFDEAGNYVLPGSGLYVKGWMGDNGSINTSAAVTNISIPSGKAMTAQATSTSNYNGNLDSSTLLITNISRGGTSAATATSIGQSLTATPVVPLQLNMSDGSTLTVSSGTYTVGYGIPITTTFTVYDSLGNQHTVPILYEKVGPTAVSAIVVDTATGGTTVKKETGSIWRFSLPSTGTSAPYTIVEDDGTVVMPSIGGSSVGYIAFDTDGRPLTGNAVIKTGKAYPGTPASSDIDLVVTTTLELKYYPNAASASVGLIPSNGSESPSTVAMNFADVTQFAGGNSIHANANGYASGVLQSVNVDSSGIITGNYSNGQRMTEAQVAVAQFNNPSGLTKTSNSLYQESNNSGAANIKSAADLGVTITPSALEMSNVDIANEFSDMIITQRGFQSNSKMVTVGDEMLETLINMKR